MECVFSIRSSPEFLIINKIFSIFFKNRITAKSRSIKNFKTTKIDMYFPEFLAKFDGKNISEILEDKNILTKLTAKTKDFIHKRYSINHNVTVTLKKNKVNCISINID